MTHQSRFPAWGHLALALHAVVVGLAACQGGGSSPPGSPTAGPTAELTITPPPNVCRVGLKLNSANRSCTRETPFFSFAISDPLGIGVWRGIFSGARQEGLTAGPARLEVGSFVAVRADDNETWTILAM